MNAKIKKMLKAIDSEEKAFGDSIYNTCSDKDIAFFKAWISQQFPIYKRKLRDYIKFSRVANALNFDGLFVYGITKSDEHSGIIYMNEVWRHNEYMEQYLFFGHDDISWYCIELHTGNYTSLDLPSGDFVEKFKTFDKMLEEMLGSRIEE